MTPLPPFVFRRDAPLTVVAPAKILRFYAGGQADQLVAEGCVPVHLDSAAEVDFCPGTLARAEVSLLANGTTIASGLPLTGTYRVSEPSDVTYTLRIETFAGTNRCQVEERSVVVKRYLLLRVAIAGQPSLSSSRQLFAIDRGSPFSVQISSSCPAPAGGVPVTLVSSRPSRLAGGTVTIPDGAAQVAFAATGADCGEVTIQVSAPGHQATTYSVLFVDQPQVTGVVPAQIPACAPIPITLTITATCAGGALGTEAGDPQVIVSGQGQQVAATITNIAVNQQDPFHGPSQIQARVPQLVAGTYTVSVSFRSRVGSAAVPLQVLPGAPAIKSFKVAPSAVVSCIPTAIDLAWNGEQATQLKLFKTDLLGTVQIASLNRAPSCAPWSDTRSVGLIDRETEFRIDAMPPAGTPVVSKTALVREEHGIYSIAGSITLENQSNRDIYIWSINSIGTDAELEDLIPHGGRTTVIVPECLRIHLVAETTGDYTEVLRSSYYWRWNLPILGRTGRVYPGQTIY